MQLRVGEYQLVYDPSVGEHDRWYINDHTFVRDSSGTWHLFGITHAEPMAPFEEVQFAHATAPALLGPWTKEPYAMHADEAWGETQLWAPHVIEHEGMYWMFYCAGGASPSEYRIHLATSLDCVHWERHAANPLIVDGYEARDPMVLRIDDRWVLYYTATSTPDGGEFIVAAAESDDLVHWVGRHVVYRDAMEGTMAGPTESPFVFRRNGLSYLLIGPDWDALTRSFADTGRDDLSAYRRTRVLVSDDPLSFAITGLLTTIDSHAAEIVVDERGDRWASHAGWGQGGVYLAPLHWHD